MQHSAVEVCPHAVLRVVADGKNSRGFGEAGEFGRELQCLKNDTLPVRPVERTQHCSVLNKIALFFELSALWVHDINHTVRTLKLCVLCIRMRRCSWYTLACILGKRENLGCCLHGVKYLFMYRLYLVAPGSDACRVSTRCTAHLLASTLSCQWCHLTGLPCRIMSSMLKRYVRVYVK